MSTSDLELGVDRDLDAVQDHFVNAYSPMELKTFHCERVRKMPLSGLDPSMLIGFLCKDEGDWIDFRKRVVEVSFIYLFIFTYGVLTDTFGVSSSDRNIRRYLQSKTSPRRGPLILTNSWASSRCLSRMTWI
jgi:hypothetical protein